MVTKVAFNSVVTVSDADPDSDTISQSTNTEPSFRAPSPSDERSQDSQHALTGESYYPIIPATHTARTLVLCFDGFGNQFDTGAYARTYLLNSTIWKLFSLLSEDDKRQQMCYYHSGIGTYVACGGGSPFLAKADVMFDKMVGWDIEAHIQDGHKFIMQNYHKGDNICLFGFSRGAYTARALAGTIDKTGLLQADHHHLVPSAFKIYALDNLDGRSQAFKFKTAFSIDVRTDFTDVWETVSFVGLVHYASLPFASSQDAIRVFRHALALDERRASFQPYFYRQAEGLSRYSRGHKNVMEGWFAGCHDDVGGGAVPDSTPHSLARISFRWMIRECFRNDTGIRFHAEGIRSTGIDPTPTVKEREVVLHPAEPHHFYTTAPLPPAASEEEYDVRDAVAPIHDPLARWSSLWWILDSLIPMRQRTWDPPVRIDFGRGRDTAWLMPFYVHIMRLHA